MRKYKLFLGKHELGNFFGKDIQDAIDNAKKEAIMSGEWTGELAILNKEDQWSFIPLEDKSKIGK